MLGIVLISRSSPCLWMMDYQLNAKNCTVECLALIPRHHHVCFSLLSKSHYSACIHAQLIVMLTTFTFYSCEPGFHWDRMPRIGPHRNSLH
jgi:hypothetical protein